MKRTWIVVACKSGAKIYERLGLNAKLELLDERKNPEAKLTNSELAADKPGRSYSQNHGGRNTYAPHDEPRKTVVKKFLKGLSDHIHLQQTNHNFDDLVIVAEPGVLGLIRPHLRAHPAFDGTKELPKDLFHPSREELTQQLERIR